MARKHVDTCEVVNLFTLAEAEEAKGSIALVRTEAFEAIHVHLPAAKTIPPHRVEGPLIVQCLSGEVDFSVEGTPHVLRAGDRMHLAGGAMHALEAREDTRILVTLLFIRPA